MSRPVNRGDADPEPTKPEEKPEHPAVHHESRPAHHRTTRRHIDESPSKKKFIIYIATALVVVVLVCLAVWAIIGAKSGPTTAIDTTKYQAVFLTNGQVYFGKLSIVFGDEYMKLTDIYYLEAEASEDAGTNSAADGAKQQTKITQNNFQLVKYSDVLYNTEDEMIISKDKVLHYENLRPEGTVGKAISAQQPK